MDIFIIVVLLVLSALFTAATVAYTSINKAKLRSLAEDGNKRAKMAIKNSESFEKSFVTISICDTAVNLCAVAMATVYSFTNWPQNMTALVLVIAVVAVLVVIFGEILPQSIALGKPEGVAMFMAYPLRVLVLVITPISWVFLGIKKVIIKLFGGKSEPQTITNEEELMEFIDEIEDEGVLDESESDLVKSAIEFSDVSVLEILVPRVNVAAVEINDDTEEIKNLFMETNFSRLPVYEKTIDAIVGVIHEKNFFKMYLSGGRDIKTIMTKPLYILELASISEAMSQMQKAQSHLAVIMDQYGGTKGIVTMEDVIEELVGEIYDETDEIDTSFVSLGENEYEVDADFSINDFMENIGLEDYEFETECNSLGGLLMEQLGYIPDAGETVKVGVLNMSVISSDDQRIERLKVSVEEEENEDIEE